MSQNPQSRSKEEQIKRLRVMIQGCRRKNTGKRVRYPEEVKALGFRILKSQEVSVAELSAAVEVTHSVIGGWIKARNQHSNAKAKGESKKTGGFSQVRVLKDASDERKHDQGGYDIEMPGGLLIRGVKIEDIQKISMTIRGQRG
jgi:transposase-like protein